MQRHTLISGFILVCYVSTITAFRGTCNIQGEIYRDGETSVRLMDNDLLYRCTCKVLPNGNSNQKCNVTREDAHVFVANGKNIAKIAIGDGVGFSSPFIQIQNGHTVAVAVDIASDYVFWTDVGSKTRGIYRARLSDGSRITRIIYDGVYEPNGIAVDYLSKTIYWTDAQLGGIYVAKYDGRFKSRLIGGLAEPRGITVIPRLGMMFWSDQSRGTIEKAFMDGTDHNIVIRGLQWPNEVAVDHLARRVYWVDGSTSAIESCGFDGDQYSLTINLKITFNSPGFGLAFFDKRLYFGVWGRDTLFSISDVGSDLKPVISRQGDRIMGITIANKKMQISSRLNNPCWEGIHGCSHLCFPISYNERTCACPSDTGLVLGNDGVTCQVPENFLLYTSLDEGTVMMAALVNGVVKTPTMLAQSDQPSAVDFDPIQKMVYWSDVATNVIYRKALNESKTEIFIENGIGVVDGLCVDWQNRYLYFTNLGWDSFGSQYHRIEMVGLDQKDKRRILTSNELSKPRDIVIDYEMGFLYISDWGIEPKVVRMDLNGLYPQKIEALSVENPNGLAVKDGMLYVTDSRFRSAETVNGTTIFSPPALVKYNTVLEKVQTFQDIEMEIPFGLTMGRNKLYLTDWGLGGIYEVSPNGGKLTEIVVGIKKPTGVKFASTTYNPITSVNACKDPQSTSCSDICVPTDVEYYSCMCSEQSGKVLSENEWNCVESDSFLLIADGNRIVLKSLTPDDEYYYAVIETYDALSNIVAVTYDPATKYVYWADNGRKKVNRKLLQNTQWGGDENHETVFSGIGRVDGMALDTANRLLYWTDAEKGTIEVLDLSNLIHATVLSRLDKPRAIVLEPKTGIMYWTEWGKYPMVAKATMNGQDQTPLLTTGLKWPNGLYYDEDNKQLYIADGGMLTIQAIVPTGSSFVLDFIDLNGTASHVFGLAKVGNSIVFSDWKDFSLLKTNFDNTFGYIRDMVRPSQIHKHDRWTDYGYQGQCIRGVHQCTHICIPALGSYTCLCPDHLVLSTNQHSCITEEELVLLTSTVPTTSTVYVTTTPQTTAAWADIIAPTQIQEILETTAQSRLMENATSEVNSTMKVIIATTAPMITTTDYETTTPQPTTALPDPPRFIECDTQSTYQKSLEPDFSKVTVTPELFSLQAVGGDNQTLNISLVEQYGDIVFTYDDLSVGPGRHTLHFLAVDEHGRNATCNVKLVVKDVSPPITIYCPDDITVDTYSKDKTAYVSWETPQFVDNAGKDQIFVTENYEPGVMAKGIHNVTYFASDRAGNTAVCSFLVAVSEKDSACNTPYHPNNTKLSCYTDIRDKLQKCEVFCEKDYQLALADPIIVCQPNAINNGYYEWLPLLNSDSVCRKPSVGNVRKVVQLQYDCPCRNSHDFYDKARTEFTTTLTKYTKCKERLYKLGYCRNANKKLTVECFDDVKLNFSITVDLATLHNIRSTKEVSHIVRRSTADILDLAEEKKIVAIGVDQKQYSYSEYDIRNVGVICEEGFKRTEEGCVICPEGSYFSENSCDYCPEHTYQDQKGQTECIPCPPGTGTVFYGMTHLRYCIEMELVQATSSTVKLIASVVAGVLLILVAFFLVIGFTYRRRKNNKFKKEQARKRALKIKQREEERQKRKKARAKSLERAKKLERKESKKDGAKESSGENKKSLKKRNSADPKLGEATPKTTSRRNSNASTINVKVTTMPPQKSILKEQKPRRSASFSVHSGAQSADDDTLSRTEIMSQTDTARSTDSTLQPGSEYSEPASKATSIVSSEMPLKSALKKRPKPAESQISEDTSTIISASTIGPAQMQRLMSKRHSSLDADHSGLRRGRPSGRSIREGTGSVSPAKMRGGGASTSSLVAMGTNNGRTTSLDRGGPNGPPPRRMFQTLPRSMPNNGPPPGMLMRRPPVTAGGPYGMVRQPVYAGFAPRNQGFPPNNMRQGFMGQPGRPVGPPPMQRTQYPGSGYWNQGYEKKGDWDTMSLRSDVDMRSSPPNMMTLPRARPRYRMPNGPRPPMGQPPNMGIPVRFRGRMPAQPPPYYA